jgi:hypothetical protein
MQATISSDWGMSLQTVVCDKCDWNYLIPEGSNRQCPHCFEGELQNFEANSENMPHLAPPELLIPYQVSENEIARLIEGFASQIPFPPEDLNVASLASRMQRIFLPMWLVDAHVNAQWNAELGYPYQVESHKSNYQGGQWYSQKVLETRLDWEKRVGSLAREYQNIPAPALDQHQALMKALGGYSKRDASVYQKTDLQQVYVRLPQRSTKDAFIEAQEAFKERAGEEVQEAAAAEKIREFRWDASYSAENWSLMLLPIYISYYTDDEGKKRLVFVNGQSAHLSGQRRGSMKRAQQYMLIGLVAAAIVMLIALGLLLFAPDIENVPVFAGILAAIIGLASLFPVYQVWQFNEQQGA